MKGWAIILLIIEVVSAQTLPDVTITGIQVNPPNYQKINNQIFAFVPLSISVTNIGFQAAGSSTLAIQATTMPSLNGFSSVNPLQVNQTEQINITLFTAVPQQLRVNITVDNWNQIMESNELNNNQLESIVIP